MRSQTKLVIGVALYLSGFEVKQNLAKLREARTEDT